MADEKQKPHGSDRKADDRNTFKIKASWEQSAIILDDLRYRNDSTFPSGSMLYFLKEKTTIIEQ